MDVEVLRFPCNLIDVISLQSHYLDLVFVREWLCCGGQNSSSLGRKGRGAMRCEIRKPIIWPNSKPRLRSRFTGPSIAPHLFQQRRADRSQPALGEGTSGAGPRLGLGERSAWPSCCLRCQLRRGRRSRARVDGCASGNLGQGLRIRVRSCPVPSHTRLRPRTGVALARDALARRVCLGLRRHEAHRGAPETVWLPSRAGENAWRGAAPHKRRRLLHGRLAQPSLFERQATLFCAMGADGVAGRSAVSIQQYSTHTGPPPSMLPH